MMSCSIGAGVSTASCTTHSQGNRRVGARSVAALCSVNRFRVKPFAAQKVKSSAQVKVAKPTKTKELKRQSSIPAPEPVPAWGFLDLAAYNQPWPVTWGLGAVAGGMFAWAASFVGLGLFLVPKAFIALGGDLRHGGPAAQATFVLSCQAIQTLVGVAIVRTVVNNGRAAAAAEKEGIPTTSAEDGLLNFSWRDPFTKPNGWAAWAILGIVLSPVVVGSTAWLLETVGYDKLMGGSRGTVDGVLPIVQPDAVSFFSLLTVTGVLAPIMEETVFRGFLLPSLSRYMPTWTAVLVTAGFFGAAHLSIRDLPVLVSLGVLLGFSYVRSRNLLTPIIIHGTWNSLVLSVLFYLSASGVDVQQLMKELSSS